MDCPNCGSKLTGENICGNCQLDVTVYKRVIRTSNMYYNDALEKAKVADITGAIQSLKKSLKLYKKNTEARNLLGLLYFRTGEIVSALSSWVVSKHFQSEGNLADAYIAEIQSSPAQLDTFNQAIKYYNQALNAVKQHNEDLAVLQLRKVISFNPNYLRAYHLLIVLYLKSGEKDKAIKYLNSASEIDVSNTNTLRYRKELNLTADNELSRTAVKSKGKSVSAANDVIIPVNKYKEDKPNVWLFLNLVIGVVLGVAVVLFLVLPTLESKYEDKYNVTKTDINDKVNAQTSTIDTLEKENEALTKKAETLQSKVNELTLGSKDSSVLKEFFNGIALYVKGDNRAAAEKLVKVKPSKLGNKEAESLYKEIQTKIFPEVAKQVYSEGYSQYSSNRWEEAKTSLTLSVSLDNTNENAYYFLARAYHRLGDTKNAKKFYEKVIADFPTTSRAAQAKGKLAEIP